MYWEDESSTSASALPSSSGSSGTYNLRDQKAQERYVNAKRQRIGDDQWTVNSGNSTAKLSRSDMRRNELPDHVLLQTALRMADELKYVHSNSIPRTISGANDTICPNYFLDHNQVGKITASYREDSNKNTCCYFAHDLLLSTLSDAQLIQMLGKTKVGSVELLVALQTQLQQLNPSLIAPFFSSRDVLTILWRSSMASVHEFIHSVREALDKKLLDTAKADTVSVVAAAAVARQFTVDQKQKLGTLLIPYCSSAQEIDLVGALMHLDNVIWQETLYDYQVKHPELEIIHKPAVCLTSSEDLRDTSYMNASETEPSELTTAALSQIIPKSALTETLSHHPSDLGASETTSVPFDGLTNGTTLEEWLETATIEYPVIPIPGDEDTEDAP